MMRPSVVKSCHECTEAQIPLLVTKVANITSMKDAIASSGARNPYSPCFERDCA